MKRPCLERSCPELTTGTRCPAHTRAVQRARDVVRGTPAARGYDYAYQRRRAEMIAAHVEAHGWVCPGYECQPHAVPEGKLTADHTVPIAAGGRDSPLIPLCLSCNSRRGAGR